MSTPDPRLSRRDAERLLDAPAEHDNVLGWALTAASAPAHPSELHGEDAAAAAFQSARLSPAPSTRSGYVSPSRLGGRAATRAVIATGAVVALTSGGFALASSTDLPGLPGFPGLPGLPGQASDRASDSTADAPRGAAGSVTPGDSGSADGSPSGSASGSPGASGSSGSSTSTTSPGSPSATPSESPSGTTDGPATPSPSFEGLCRAFQATDRSDAGSSLDSAAFLALATQAGGADRIATYCVDLIGPPKQTGKPTPSPSPGKPTDQPTNGNQGNQNNSGNQGNQGNQNSGNNNAGSQNNSSTNQPNPNSQSNNGNGNGNGPGKSGSSSNPSPATTPATPTSPASPTTSPTDPGKPGNPDKGGGAHTSG
ncbi:hypothetical protein IEZ26_03940 [Nocardioides cavernae]|uniref:DUF732 domain-containing protein n=1 Tax=Nocardioides cavernae TaxID=1921566 RepID=A0ABR8N881_9ACTN|nr:hypothetical protein [Nocardioides cavernae]MBD3923761.1 hypothetical protein [Nocardioides cavernae]MBM7511306.1 hypothetical protein [Nocardioides cavernae]